MKIVDHPLEGGVGDLNYVIQKLNTENANV